MATQAEIREALFVLYTLVEQETRDNPGAFTVANILAHPRAKGAKLVLQEAGVWPAATKPIREHFGKAAANIAAKLLQNATIQAIADAVPDHTPTELGLV